MMGMGGPPGGFGAGPWGFGAGGGGEYPWWWRNNRQEAGSYVSTNPELAGHKYCRNPLPGSRNRGIWCHTIKGNWEYCNPKMPDISWTDVMTIEWPRLPLPSADRKN
eukprot:s2711_g5.t1